MPRDASSNYTLPAGNPVVSSSIISSVWANNTLNDIATALSNSLSTDGSVSTANMSGKNRVGGTVTSATINGSLANSFTLAGTTNMPGGQLIFPATQNPSGSPNCLDDYEEGTWTPTLTYQTPGNLNVVYGTRVGTYTKVGRQVHLSWHMGISTWTHSTAANSMLVSGCPFVCTDTFAVGAGLFSGLSIGTGSFPIPYGLNPTPFIGSTTSAIAFDLPGINNSQNVNITALNHVSGSPGSVSGSITYNTNT